MNYPADPSLAGLSVTRGAVSSDDLASRSQIATAPERVNVASGAVLASFIEWLAGILNLPRALVQPAKQPSRVYAVLRSPTRPFDCSVVVHVEKHEPRSIVSVQLCVGEFKYVVG